MCEYKQNSTLNEYLQHLRQHLKNHETLTCIFQSCSYKTNVYGSFKTHRYRNHRLASVSDLKAELTLRAQQTHHSSDDINADNLHEDFSENEEASSAFDTEDLSSIEHKIASVLLKLEHVFLVPSVAIDYLLQELHYLIRVVSVPVTYDTITQLLQKYNCQVDIAVVQELASVLCESSPIQSAVGDTGPLSTSWKRKVYYKNNFSVVEPVEYVLDQKSKRSFQYVPILKALQQILSCQPILDKAINLKFRHVGGHGPKYTCFFDSLNFQQNELLSSETAISLILYADEFEICNPLGTSKKIHKILGVYWILGNLPPGYHSSLSSINLAALINSNDVKQYGYEKVLEPLLDDLVTLEQHGVYVSKLGKTLKGTVQCIVADNLGAHSIAGFVENFSGTYVCRFCTAKSEEFQTIEVNSGAFCLRTKGVHAAHLEAVREGEVPHFGVKGVCVLSERLSYFNVTTGFPPDIAHDLFEGIIPVEVALCLAVFVGKKYFTLHNLNEAIRTFPFKWSDKNNRPHPVPLAFSTKKRIGGNAHENWSLVRFLPLLIGDKVPADEPAWQVLTDLKDIVDLVVAPFHTKESVAYLDSKISEHRLRFQEVFPDQKILPKHHYLEHYSQLIEQYGPLVELWTMRFESKHSFFKRVVRHTNCFKNVLLSLSQRHQFHIAHHLHLSSLPTSTLKVGNVSSIPIDVLCEEISCAVKEKHPNLDVLCMAENVTYEAYNYRKGMIISHGELAGLPEFCEIIQMIILQEKPLFVVRQLDAWYTEHYRAFILTTSARQILLLEHHSLNDPYPLADYTIQGRRLVVPKRYIHV